MSYALVVGEKGERKSAVMKEVAAALAARGLRIAGFAQRTFEEGPGRKVVDLDRLGRGGTVRLARTTVDPGAAPAVCSFAFDENAFAEVRRWIEEDVAGADVILLDGVGKIELGGGGHRAAVDHAFRAGPPVVLSIRDEHLVYAMEALGLDEPLASYTTAEDAAALGRFVEAVARAAGGAVKAPACAT